MPIPGVDLTSAISYDNAAEGFGGIPVGPLVGPPGLQIRRDLRLVMTADRKPLRLRWHRQNVARWLARNYLPNIVAACDFQVGDSALLLGAGFGWEAELLQQWSDANGMDLTICNIDPAPWVQGNKDLPERASLNSLLTDQGFPLGAERAAILEAIDPGGLPRSRHVPKRGGVPIAGASNVESGDVGNGGARGRIKRLYHGGANVNFTWGITINVLTWLTDSECVALDTAGHAIADNVLHAFSEYASRLDDRPPEPNFTSNWKWLNAARDQGWTKLNDPIPSWGYTTTNWRDLIPLPSLLLTEEGLLDG